MRIAYISTFLPRECGIATFNDNLIKAIAANSPEGPALKSTLGVALHELEDVGAYDYPDEVELIIRQDYQEDYLRAAAILNTGDVQACILQHEFGIFGGDNGVYLLPLVHQLKKPLVSILHTILERPSYSQRMIIREIARQSEKVVVMSHRGLDFLTSIYHIPADKIHLIEHGVPDLEPPQPNPLQETFPFRNRRVLFSFGLLSPNKGLETIIQALPAIVAKHPEVIYVVLGKTHPGVLRHSGEEYREQLKRLALSLKVEQHLVFINKFVFEHELINYLSAAFLYITPYTQEAQITSGTLSYAVGAGAAVISTPYWHAQELLADNRGRLFGFKDHVALARIVHELLEEPDSLQVMKQNAYNYGLHLRWPRIGAQYIEVLEEARRSAATPKITSFQIIDPELIPEFSLAHIRRLTDDTGIVQHAKYGIPNLKEGYCLDDNARALIMALMAYQRHKSKEALDLLPVYLSYIHYMQREDGNFRNFLSFTREFLDEVGSEDSFGRTIWALGFLISAAPNHSYREFAGELFARSVPHFSTLTYLRGMANTIIGISYYLKVHPEDDSLRQELADLTANLLSHYRRHKGKNWHWFEDQLTYDNAILPLALLHAYEILGEETIKAVALEALEFLEQLTFRDGYLSPIGNDGWYYRGGKIAVVDQQAIETMAMVLMYLQAFRVSHQAQYLHKLFLSYQWFLGENLLRLPLYDHETKGCCDGLLACAINRNQGAESTLAYLISHLAVLDALELEDKFPLTDREPDP